MTEEESVEVSPEQLKLANILWEKERECNSTLNSSSGLQGLYCPGLFDGWVCWPDTAPGESATHPCPEFIVGFDPDRIAYRKCEENGEWFFHTVFNKTWSNYTTCVNMEELSFRQTVITVYSMGYSISLVALIMSLAILSYFKSLRCARITVHMNLFASFAANNLLWLLWYNLVVGTVEVVSANRGEPAKLLSGISISNDNYVMAYNKLVDRYNNKRLLASKALNAVLSATLRSDTAKELRSLLNTFSESLSILQALGFETNQWDFIIFHILLEKLDVGTRTKFEIQYSGVDFPKYDDLFQFLENKCKALESVQHLSNFKSNKPISNIPNNKPYLKGYSKPSAPFSLHNGVSTKWNGSNIKCCLCRELHTLSRCPRFLEKSPSDRNACVQKHKLCTNCLHKSHGVQQCRSSFNCRICNARHHSTLHISKITNPNADASHTSEAQSVPDTPSTSSGTQTTTSGNTYAGQSTVLLATAIVDICNGRGNFQPIRILIDSGSQSNFISETCLRRLGLTRRHFSTSILGLNQMASFTSKGLTNCVIRPKNLPEPSFSFDAIVVSKLCADMPSFDLHTSDWDHLIGLHLADEGFSLSGPIDLLVGAEIFTQILLSGRIIGNVGQPTAFETVFGWVLIGKINNSSIPSQSNAFFTSSEPPLELSIPKFWEIEQVPTKIFSSPEDKKCENIFKQTITREPSGRFVVSLPFKNSEPDLGDTYTQALRRFYMLESRLLKNPELYSAYSNFMKEYVEKGHMTLVSTEVHSPLSCFLPHHCVVKPDSVSTKLRVVWDGSAKGSKGLSLNDTLLPGPKLQKDIFSLLLIFRLHPVVFIADVQQMFRQILVAPAHRNFQKILWRFSPEEPLREYTLNTVTFGLNCSPYLAMRTLNELADLEQSRFPQASKLIKTQIYVDDIMGTCPSVSSALSLQKELIDLLKLGGFELRKWASNSPELLAAVSNSDRQMPLSFDKDEPHYLKVLGLQWQPYTDSFSYKCQLTDRSCTKRTILSDIGRIFDPLGFLSPILLTAKYIMQRLWTSKVDWDEPPDPDTVASWNQIRDGLPELSNLSLPRRVLVDNLQRCELHGFCDASTIGYGAVVYFRVETNDKNSVFLVCAKGRVAPLKSLTIPKLELTAAKLLADLILCVKDTYSGQIVFDEITAWSDSQVVLAWLNSSPSRWKTFVANRVSYIQDIIPSKSWRYIPSALNVSDAASRGMSPSDLLAYEPWWNGPSFLSTPKSEWCHDGFFPRPSEKEAEVEREEKRSVLTLHVDSHVLDSLLEKYSSLTKIQRILSYCFRVQINFKNNSNRLLGNPSTDELHKALMCLIKHVQYSTFVDIISKLDKGLLLPKPFRKIALFLDTDGFLRVGGRLRNSDLAYSIKHPLLLPNKHRLTTLLIGYTHEQYLHPGLKTLHNLLLQQFWILSARRAIQRTLSGCVRCFKARPKLCAPPIMGDLPAHRVSEIKPFSHVALDFCGPFFVTIYRSRGAKVFKAYVCVFVCTATKAIHLELTQELSTDSFVAAFKRFIARRGRVVECYSDNGTNFVGANNQFIEHAKQAAETLSFRWNFSPPSGPHFNGLAEAGVKMLKSHLLRVVGEQRLTSEELSTLLCQIEAVLNSRPLCAQSADPNDLIPLTPSHFLTLEPLNCVLPEPDLPHSNLTRLSRWQVIQRLHADFWKRYSLEYLNTLQQRLKWSTPAEEIKINDLVLVKTGTTPPLQWPLGRVVELHRGEDGHTRVVTVRTARGQYRRPVVKLCRLPIA